MVTPETLLVYIGFVSTKTSLVVQTKKKHFQGVMRRHGHETNRARRGEEVREALCPGPIQRC